MMLFTIILPILAGAALNVSALTGAPELFVTTAVLVTLSRPFFHLMAAVTSYVADRPSRLFGASAAATGNPDPRRMTSPTSAPVSTLVTAIPRTAERCRPAVRRNLPSPSLSIGGMIACLRTTHSRTFAYRLRDDRK